MNKLLSTTLVSIFVAAAGASMAIAQRLRIRIPAPRPVREKIEERAFARPGERVEARLAYIKTALKSRMRNSRSGMPTPNSCARMRRIWTNACRPGDPARPGVKHGNGQTQSNVLKKRSPSMPRRLHDSTSFWPWRSLFTPRCHRSSKRWRMWC